MYIKLYLITLLFLGNIVEEKAESLIQKFPHLTCQIKSFSLQVKQFAFFPERKPYMIWAVSALNSTYSQLTFDLHKGLNLPGQPARVSITHITIARFKNPDVTRQLSLPPIINPLELKVDKITLWESVLSKSGAVYCPLHLLPLG